MTKSAGWEISIKWRNHDVRQKYMDKNGFGVTVTTPGGRPIEYRDKTGVVITIPANDELVGSMVL